MLANLERAALFVGTPRALVTSAASDVALATDKALHLWRHGTNRRF